MKCGRNHRSCFAQGFARTCKNQGAVLKRESFHLVGPLQEAVMRGEDLFSVAQSGVTEHGLLLSLRHKFTTIDSWSKKLSGRAQLPRRSSNFNLKTLPALISLTSFSLYPIKEKWPLFFWRGSS